MTIPECGKLKYLIIFSFKFYIISQSAAFLFEAGFFGLEPANAIFPLLGLFDTQIKAGISFCSTQLGILNNLCSSVIKLINFWPNFCCGTGPSIVDFLGQCAGSILRSASLSV